MAVLTLDPSSPTPPYEQVRGQIIAAIENGVLGPGTQLPTVRQLARDLGLAVNTVARAYRELELAGVVETRGRQGTFVAGPTPQSRQLAAETARAFLTRMSELGIDAAGAIAIVRHEAERIAGASAASPRRAGEPAKSRLAPQS